MNKNYLFILAALLITLAACKKDEDIADNILPIVLTCGDFNQDLTLTNDPDKPIDYIVDCLSQVTGRLTIEPGVVIQFNDDTGLLIIGNGSINAKGTSDSKVVFTSRTKQNGAWRGLYIETANVSNVLEHVRLEYAGGNSFNSNDNRGAIVMWADSRLTMDFTEILNSENNGLSMEYDNANLQMNNSRIRNTVGTPVITSAANLTRLNKTNDFSGNQTDRIRVRPRAFVNTSTIQKLNVPYRFEPDGFFLDFPINNASVLTIEAGTTIEMGSGVYILINDQGALKVEGTEADPVLFTGVDKIPGSWAGLYFNATNSVNNLINHAIIEYAGDGSDSGVGGVTMWSSPRLAIRNTLFRNIPTCAMAHASGGINSNLTTENISLVNVTGGEFCE